MAQPSPTPRTYAAGLLPFAEVCPGVLDVATTRDPPPGIGDLWREAFVLGGMAPTAFSMNAYREAKARLPNLYALDVEAALEDYQADVRSGLIPSVHRFATDVDGDLEGRVPAVGRERIFHRVDCVWHASPAEKDDGRVVVLQHELAREGMRDVLDLDLVFAGIAMAVLYDTKAMQLGRCYHAPGKPAVYRWSRTLGETEMEAYWERIARVFRRRREVVATTLCESCPVRRRCPEWMLPAVYGGAAPGYKQLSGQDPLAANDVTSVRRFVKSLRDAAEIGEAQLRTLKREGAA